jgi:hypothetical protein
MFVVFRNVSRMFEFHGTESMLSRKEKSYGQHNKKDCNTSVDESLAMFSSRNSTIQSSTSDASSSRSRRSSPQPGPSKKRSRNSPIKKNGMPKSISECFLERAFLICVFS